MSVDVGCAIEGEHCEGDTVGEGLAKDHKEEDLNARTIEATRAIVHREAVQKRAEQESAVEAAKEHTRDAWECEH